MTAIIVDDEPQSHHALRELLSRNHPDINVLSSAYSVQEGYEHVVKYQPDLVFLDIELPDGLGFDILKKIGDPDFLVIFFTAHNHYARTAIDFGAFGYLLKPVTTEMLKKSLDKVRRNRDKNISRKQFELLLQTLSDLQQQQLPARMSVSTMQGVYFFDIPNIIRLEAQQNYTLFVLNGPPNKLLASTNIGSYSKHFDGFPEFCKPHRSHLINRNYIVKYVRSESYLLMQNGDKVPVSRSGVRACFGGATGGVMA